MTVFKQTLYTEENNTTGFFSEIHTHSFSTETELVKTYSIYLC